MTLWYCGEGIIYEGGFIGIVVGQRWWFPRKSSQSVRLFSSLSFPHYRFLYYDEIKDAKDPIDDYEGMIELTVNGHRGRLTKDSCECLMTRGMYQQPDGKYKFNRDNRVKVRWQYFTDSFIFIDLSLTLYIIYSATVSFFFFLHRKQQFNPYILRD